MGKNSLQIQYVQSALFGVTPEQLAWKIYMSLLGMKISRKKINVRLL